MNDAIIIAGNPIDGMTVIGPFIDADRAVEYATYGALSNNDWWVTVMATPAVVVDVEREQYAEYVPTHYSLNDGSCIMFVREIPVGNPSLEASLFLAVNECGDEMECKHSEWAPIVDDTPPHGTERPYVPTHYSLTDNGCEAMLVSPIILNRSVRLRNENGDEWTVSYTELTTEWAQI